ncbi:MAG: hypothetical protein IK099_15410 [Clostridia bacterium]|nr:hypothetical protein [Clostridia bacterium]
MKTKRLIDLLCVVIVLILVGLVVVLIQKNKVGEQVNELRGQVAALETQMSDAAKNAAAELESARAAAAEAAGASAQELERLQAASDDTAKELERVTSEAQAAAKEIEQLKAALQAAEDKASLAEAELSGLREQREALAAAKEQAEKEAARAKEEAERVLSSVTAAMTGTVREENTPIAMILYENTDHTVRAYSQDFTDGVTASLADVRGEGTYTVGLSFDRPAEGLYFMALSIENGEARNPGWVVDVKEVKVNGQPVELGKVYTVSDDGLRTRVNLFNAWVKNVPEDARFADADAQDASAVAVSPDDFAAVETVEITFDYLPPETDENP